MNNINTCTNNFNFKEVKNMNNIDTLYQSYEAENGMYDQIEMTEMAYYNDLFKDEEGGSNMDTITTSTTSTNQFDQDDLLNEMYEQAEMEELAYYRDLFKDEEERGDDNGEEVEKFLKDLDANRDEDHYKHLKEVHERFTKDFS